MTGEAAWGGEPRYTLAEAQREIARQECQVHGHDFDVVQEVGRGPVEIICSRGCGASWKVGIGIFDADRLAKCVRPEQPPLEETRQAAGAVPVLDFTFRGWPGKLTVQVMLTDIRGREHPFAVPVQVEYYGGEPVLTLDLKQLTDDVCEQLGCGAVGP